MRHDTPARWQAAVSLANSLRAEGSANKDNAELARQVAQLLDEEIDKDSQSENDLKLRVYLAKCLGEFTVPDAVDVLLKASTTQRHEDEVEVRWAAVCSLAVMADGCQGLTADVPEVVPTLIELSSDDETVVRSAAAFALGVVGDEASLARLRLLLTDAYPDVRYNAATGLCRQRVTADTPIDELYDVLTEMLDPEETAGIVVEEDVEATREAKRWMIVSNGMKAVEQFVAANPDADVAPLLSALERLEQQGVPRGVSKAAANLRLSIEERSSSPATAAR
jgi:HEAT repeat protein